MTASDKVTTQTRPVLLLMLCGAVALTVGLLGISRVGMPLGIFFLLLGVILAERNRVDARIAVVEQTLAQIRLQAGLPGGNAHAATGSGEDRP